MAPMSASFEPLRDPSTLSNYDCFVTSHIIANLEIDFDREVVTGNVILILRSVTDAAAKEIVFDTSYLSV